MLPRASRVHRSQDIKQIVRYGNRIITPYMLIYWQQRDAAVSPRIACVVGKKVHKRAYRRHRLQRLLRALARETITHTKDGAAMVWVGRPNLSDVTGLEQLRQSIVSYRAQLPYKD